MKCWWGKKKTDVIVHHEVLTITFCALWTRSLACSWSLGHMSDLIGFMIHLCLHPCRPLRQMCASRDHVLHSLGTHPQIGPTPYQMPSRRQEKALIGLVGYWGVGLLGAMVPPVCAVPPSIDVLKGWGQRSGLQRLGQTPAHEYGSSLGSANHLVHPIGSETNAPAERAQY